MKITPVYKNNLFLLEDIVPNHLVTKISEMNWMVCEWTRHPAQDHSLRRKVNSRRFISEIHQYIEQAKIQIEQVCNINFLQFDTTFEYWLDNTSWWVDEPGFDIAIHTDGTLPSSMQLFWIAPSIEYGTTFYNSKIPSDINVKFNSIPNTGYLMLNQPGEDNSQPLLWHGMLNTVPNDTFRLTSYTTFGPYENK